MLSVHWRTEQRLFLRLINFLFMRRHHDPFKQRVTNGLCRLWLDFLSYLRCVFILNDRDKI